MIRATFSVLLTFCVASQGGAQLLSVDPSVKIDTLANGLTYYLRENAEPAGRVELRLVVNAGSVLEEDDQRGIAHFVEHMLFNGTERFPKQALVDFLERAGMRFGPDVNAYTSFDETVYMLEVPTDSMDVLQKGFEVLRDWATHALLDSVEIEAERGVILEEWRSGLGATGRIRDQVMPFLVAGSRYARRLPIGDTLVIKRGPPEALRRYYRRWYRPDLMAVVIVGDLPTDTAAALVTRYFGDLTRPTGPPERPEVGVPLVPGIRFKIVTDPESPTVLLELLHLQSANTVTTRTDLKSWLANQLARSMLNRRLADIARDGARSPFLWARVTGARYVRPLQVYSLAAQVEEDSIYTGLSALVREGRRAFQHGFTAGEIRRQKQQVLRFYERAANERDTTPSASHAGDYVRHFLTTAPVLGAELEYRLIQELVPEITADELHGALIDQLSDSSRVLLLTLPERDDLALPTETNLARILSEAAALNTLAYTDEDSEQPLLAKVPVGGRVVHESKIDPFGVTVLRLQNGPHVVLKPTTFRKDRVVFTAFSPGGTSLVGDSAYFTASLADLLVRRSGVGDFDQSSLVKRLTGTVASVSPVIGELSEGFGGSASTQDLETLFQLIFLYATEPRLDESALRSFQNHQRAQLANREATPGGAFQDTLFTAFYANNSRRKLMSVDQIDALRADEALAFYRDRFADMEDFIFIFVGDFELGRIRTLATQYLGALPATDRDETWRDVEPDLPLGAVVKEVHKGQDPQSRVALIFHGPLDYTRINRHLLSVLEAVLSMRLREELREARGAIYSASVRSSATRLPRGAYTMNVFFGCAPEHSEELIQAVFHEIARIQTDLELEPYLTKVKQQQRRTRETSLEQNGFWMDTLRFYFENESEDITDIIRYDELIHDVTTEDVRGAARSWLADRYVQVTLLPEGK